MAEEELCPEAKEYHKWYDREAAPRLHKFAAHFANCPRCQRLLLSIKDKAAFDLLVISDEEFIQGVRERLKHD